MKTIELFRDIENLCEKYGVHTSAKKDIIGNSELVFDNGLTITLYEKGVLLNHDNIMYQSLFGYKNYYGYAYDMKKGYVRYDILHKNGCILARLILSNDKGWVQ